MSAYLLQCQNPVLGWKYIWLVEKQTPVTYKDNVRASESKPQDILKTKRLYTTDKVSSSHKNVCLLISFF